MLPSRPGLLALVLAATTMLAGCFPIRGPRSEVGPGQHSQEISSIGFFPLAGHVVYRWRSVPEDGEHPVKPWARALLTPLVAVAIPVGIVMANVVFLGT